MITPQFMAVLLILQAGGADNPRGLVAGITQSVSQGKTDSIRTVWSARLSRDPSDRNAILALGTLARLTYNYEEASRHYVSLVGRESPWDRVAVYALLGEGLVQVFHGSIAIGGTYWERATGLAARLGDRAGEAEGWMGQGYVRSRSDGPTVGRRTLERAGPLIPAQDLSLRSTYHCMRSVILTFEGNPEAAPEGERGLALAREAGDRRAEAKCVQVLAGFSVYLADERRTIALFDSAEALQRAAYDWNELANTITWRAFQRIFMFDHEGAQRDLVEAMAVAQRSGNTFALAWAERNLGHLLWHLHDLSSAIEHLTRADSLMVKIADEGGLASTREVEAAVALDAGQTDRAELIFRQLAEWAERTSQAVMIFSNQYGLARVAMMRGQWARAEQELKRAEEYGRKYGLSGWTVELSYDLGLVALRQRKLDLAERQLRKFLAVTQGQEYLDRYSARSRLAEVAILRGEPGRAAAEIAEATAELDSVRSSLDDRQIRVLLFQTHRGYDDPDVGLSSIVAGLAMAGLSEQAFGLVEQRRARQLQDQLRRARLVQGQSGASFSFSTHARSRETLAALPPTAAIIEYITGESGQPTTAFLLTTKGLSSYILAPIDSLRDHLARMNAALQSGRQPGVTARVLGKELLGALLADIPAGVTSLVIVPDGFLHQLPFDALLLADGSSVITRYAVSFSPSATMAADQWNSRIAAAEARTLVLADPEFGGSNPDPLNLATTSYREAFIESGGLPRLTASVSEARAVGRYRGTEVRLGADASEAFVKSGALKAFNILHFATHAVVDDRTVTRSALALAAGEGEDGFLTAADLATLQLKADLVVLSACRTARGVVVGGEGVQGLAAPLLESGVRSVLATLWPIEDRSTGRMIELFYRGMGEGLTAAEALRQAKLEAAEAGIPSSTWAAFTLMGDPGVTFTLRQSFRWPTWIVATICVGGILILLERKRRVAGMAG